MDFPATTLDPHSFARPEEAYVKHMDLELNVNFRDNILEGRAVLTIKRKKPSVNHVILDRLGFYVTSVANMDNQPLYIYHFDTPLGSPIYVRLPQVDDTIYNLEYKIQIKYKTIPTSPALHWLTPEQTVDGKHQFLFSNNQLTYARTWFPCQDTPSVKFTYTAKISVPKTFTVLMSALLQNVCVGPKQSVYEFCQDKLVPSYAVIIAVGVLEKEELNAQSNLYAEATYFTSAYHTFRSGINTIECMLKDAKSCCGPYVWGRYDICVLPPSIAHFEIGCPCVMFISPLLLHGDSSCISSLSQRISESWAGCLVTCSNYEHLWLNKSFSIFISRKIMSKLLIQIEDMNFFLKREGVFMLREKIQESRKILSHPEKYFHNIIRPECLISIFKGSLPDTEDIRNVPYEMGCTILDELERMLGGPSVFEPFLKSYFIKFAFKSLNSHHWRMYLYQHFSDKKEMLDNIPWVTWFGVNPPLLIVPEETAWEMKYSKLAEEWVKWDWQTHTIPDGNINLHLERILFLRYLYNLHEKLTRRKLMRLLEHYKFEDHCENNADIRFLWLLLCVKVRWAKKVDAALDFAIEYCLPHVVCTIFQHLYEWEIMRQKVIKKYKKNKEKMLCETQKQLEAILHL